MSQEHEKIERMVQQGKLSRAEADELLAALEPKESHESRPPIQGAQPHGRRTFRIHVNEVGGDNVDLGFPMALAGIGLNILARKGGATVGVDGKQVPIDIEEIRHLIADPAFVGELMHIHAGDGDDVILSIE
ncbi:MAG: hypothetical protein ACYDH4_02480 [Candidatus Cryosericum sp.]